MAELRCPGRVIFSSDSLPPLRPGSEEAGGPELGGACLSGFPSRTMTPGGVATPKFSGAALPPPFSVVGSSRARHLLSLVAIPSREDNMSGGGFLPELVDSSVGNDHVPVTMNAVYSTPLNSVTLSHWNVQI